MEFERFVPTPEAIIDAKLELAGLKKGDILYDLGCGEGDVLISAARQYGTRGVGIEIQAELVNRAKKKILDQNLQHLVQIYQQDYMSVDLKYANVVVLYLNRNSLGKLSLKLEDELMASARIVTHQFDLPAWQSSLKKEFILPDGSQEVLYLYHRCIRSL